MKTSQIKILTRRDAKKKLTGPALAELTDLWCGGHYAPGLSVADGDAPDEVNRWWHRCDELNRAMLISWRYLTSEFQASMGIVNQRVMEFEQPYIEFLNLERLRANGRRYRFSTLLRQCGRPRNHEQYTGLQPAACRILTIHHGETDDEPYYGVPGCSSLNVVGRAVFPRPLPGDCAFVIGVLQHAEDGMF